MKFIFKFAPLVFSLGFIAVAWTLIESDFSQVFLESKNFSLFWFLCATISYLVSNYFAAFKFQRIVNRRIKSLEKDVVGLTLKSLFVSNFIPVGPSADIYRVYSMKKSFGWSVTDGLLLVAIDRGCSIIYTLIFGSMFSVYLEWVLQPASSVPELSALYLGASFCGLVMIWVTRNGWVLRLVTSDMFLTAESWLRSFSRGCMRALEDVVMIGCFIGQLASFAFGLYLTTQALGIEGSFQYMLFLSPIIFITNSIPIAFNGWGSRELVLIAVNSPSISGIMDVEIAVVSVASGLAVLMASAGGLIVNIFPRFR